MASLWLTGFRRTTAGTGMSALTSVCIAAMMFVPALAAVVVTRWVCRPRPRCVRHALGLVLPRPFSRLVGLSLLAVAVPLGLQLCTLAVAAAAGTYHADLTDFSGFREQFAPDTVGDHGVPVGRIALWLLATVPMNLVWLPMFFGEEIGWQGFLFPRLRALGTAAALVLTGVVFGLWHLPTLLLGGQYPGRSGVVSVAAMLVSAVLVVPVFAWLRVVSGSVLGGFVGVLALTGQLRKVDALTRAQGDPVPPVG